MSTGPKSSIESPLWQALHKYQLEVVITSSYYICQWTEKRQKVEQNRETSDEMSEELNRLRGHPSSRSNSAPKYACVLSVFFESLCVWSPFNDCNTSEWTQLIFLQQTPFLKSYHLFPNSLLTMDCHYALANNFPDCSIVQALFSLIAFLSLELNFQLDFQSTTRNIITLHFFSMESMWLKLATPQRVQAGFSF